MELHKLKLSIDITHHHILLLLAVPNLDQHFTETFQKKKKNQINENDSNNIW